MTILLLATPCSKIVIFGLELLPVLTSSRASGTIMKQSEHFLENAENCAQLAGRTNGEPAHNRYKRTEATWRASAERQD